MSNESDRQESFNELANAYGADLYRYAMWICGNDALAKDLTAHSGTGLLVDMRGGLRRPA